MALIIENPTNIHCLVSSFTSACVSSCLENPEVLCVGGELIHQPPWTLFLGHRRGGRGPYPCSYTPGSPRKVSLANGSVSLRCLYAALNIKLNPALPARATLQKPLTICKFGDMAGQFLRCQQFGPFLIGTNYLQVCPWATGLLMGQLLGLPTREDSTWGSARLLASASLPTGQRADGLVPSWAHLTLCF